MPETHFADLHDPLMHPDHSGASVSFLGAVDENEENKTLYLPPLW